MNWQLVAAGLLFYAAGVGAFTGREPDYFHSVATRALAPLLYQGTLVVFLALYILIQEMGILYGLPIAFASLFPIDAVNRVLIDGIRSILGLLALVCGLVIFFLGFG